MTRRLAALVLAAVAALVLVVVLLTGVLGGDGDDGDEGPAAAPTPTTSTPPTPDPADPLDQVDTLTTEVVRTAFCDRVTAEEVEAALGGAPTDTTAYADGQSAQLTGPVQDIAHEYACGWSTATATARAWVFAPPVTPRVARGLARDIRAENDCQAQPDAPAYGRPSLAMVCPTRRGVQASFRGLFGDAWLTCTIAGTFDRAEAMERADRWCSAVLAAAAA